MGFSTEDPKIRFNGSPFFHFSKPWNCPDTSKLVWDWEGVTCPTSIQPPPSEDDPTSAASPRPLRDSSSFFVHTFPGKDSSNSMPLIIKALNVAERANPFRNQSINPAPVLALHHFMRTRTTGRLILTNRKYHARARIEFERRKKSICYKLEARAVSIYLPVDLSRRSVIQNVL